jgi:hypothetical protein
LTLAAWSFAALVASGGAIVGPGAVRTHWEATTCSVY